MTKRKEAELKPYIQPGLAPPTSQYTSDGFDDEELNRMLRHSNRRTKEYKREQKKEY